VAAAAGGVLALALTVMGVRLAAGPLDAGWLKPMAEKALASQVVGGRAHIDRLSVSWFAPERSLGVELDGVSLTDGKGRPVLRARHMDGGFALDGLLSLTPAIGRVAANDFFAAVSVSPKGKYALGYDAQGAPGEGPSRFLQTVNDLVGREKFARPNSFLRWIELTNGRLALRQVGGPVAWTAEIRALDFAKLNGRLSTRADVVIADAKTPQRAVINARGAGLIGLKGASASGVVQGLVPAQVFPSAGSSAPLSTLAAEVDGHGAIAYDLKAGVRSADLTLTAGKGAWKSGANVEAFQSAQVVAGYSPKTGMIELTTLKLDAQKTQLDLTGRFRLVPVDPQRHRPARVDFTVGGPRVFATLADDSAPQEVNNVLLIGRYIPERRRLELNRFYGQIGNVPLAAGAVFTADDQARWGVKLTGRVGGTVTPPQVLAFWPKSVAGPVREWLRTSVLSGQLSNAAFRIDAAPGEFSKPKLKNEDLRIAFDFRDAALRFAPGFTPISAGVGRGVVEGNRFDLALQSGRMDNVQLSEGTIEIPAFKPDGGPGIFKARAVGDAHEIMTILDRPPLKLFSPNGFSPDRVSGQADLRFEVDRPMLFEVPAKDYRVQYQAVIHNGGLKDAALGWDLTGGELKVEGDEDKVTVSGPAVVGPYRGKIEFATRYQGEHLDHSMTIDADGLMQASILGGKRGVLTPFAGKFRVEGGAGTGTVHSPVFDGRLAWKDGNGPDRLTLNGWAMAPALRKIGAPFVAGAPDRFPVDMRLARAGDVWRGPFRADALAANVTYMPTPQRTRIVVQADVTPIEAKRMGLGTFPLFNQNRQVIVDANWAGAQGAAQIRAASLNLGVAWNDNAAGGAERRLRGDLTGADLALLGLPPLLARPGAAMPVSAVWKDTNDGLLGSADVDAIPVKFQTQSGKSGATVFTVHADLDANAMRRIGAPDLIDIAGATSLNARWATVQRASAGRVEFDFARAGLSVAHTDWKKPAGQAGHLSVDFVAAGDGPVRLTRINAEGPAMDIEGSGQLSSSGKMATLDLTRTRLNGLIDASMHITEDAAGQSVAIKGRWLDVRRLVADVSEPGGQATSTTNDPPLRIDADVDGLRFSDGLPLRATTIKGVWGGAPALRRLDISASMAGGGRVSGKLYPSGGSMMVLAQATDAGEAARTLFNLQTVKGGNATVTGKLVDGGADLTLEMRNVRLVKEPTVSQILAAGSLRSEAENLNGQGVLFSYVYAPVQLRGNRMLVGESRATGAALGVTAKGVVDLSKATIDVQGAIAPAYALNAAIGHVPVLGQILTSRKGEGVVGLGYWAKGSFEKPQVTVNPLSLMTPGILRRMFEAPTPVAAPPKPAKVTRADTTGGG
jgi:hypothetical protein